VGATGGRRKETSPHVGSSTPRALHRWPTPHVAIAPWSYAEGELGLGAMQAATICVGFNDRCRLVYDLVSLIRNQPVRPSVEPRAHPHALTGETGSPLSQGSLRKAVKEADAVSARSSQSLREYYDDRHRPRT
jgi:hypothetical protein